MPKKAGRAPGWAEEGEDRFDGASVRRILERAAEMQHRLSKNLADSYSREELEEMAAEAGISPAALRAAIEEHGADTNAADARVASATTGRPGWAAVLKRRMLLTSPPVRRAALAGAGGVALFALLLAFPVIAEGLFWGTALALIAVALLVAIGVFPS